MMEKIYIKSDLIDMGHISQPSIVENIRVFRKNLPDYKPVNQSI